MNGGTVYRAYDSNGTLLYVGLATTAARLDQHRATSDWFHNAARVDLQHFDTRAEAARAEAVAISTEHPLANRAQPITVRPASVPSRVWAERERLGLSQEQLAVKAGLSGRTVARIESATYWPTHSPQFNTLTRIAAALGVTTADLLNSEVAS